MFISWLVDFLDQTIGTHPKKIEDRHLSKTWDPMMCGDLWHLFTKEYVERIVKNTQKVEMDTRNECLEKVCLKCCYLG